MYLLGSALTGGAREMPRLVQSSTFLAEERCQDLSEDSEVSVIPKVKGVGRN